MKTGEFTAAVRYGLPIAAVSLVLAACGGSNNGEREATSTPAASPDNGSDVYTPPKRETVLLKGSQHTEVVQFEVGTPTLLDYEHAANPGPRIPQGTEVKVDCLATGPLEAAPSAHGNPGEKGAKWYHITRPAQYAGYFAAANTFENGDTSGPVSSQPAEDPKVPPCP
jgi:hypothetical protein